MDHAADAYMRVAELLGLPRKVVKDVINRFTFDHGMGLSIWHPTHQHYKGGLYLFMEEGNHWGGLASVKANELVFVYRTGGKLQLSKIAWPKDSTAELICLAMATDDIPADSDFVLYQHQSRIHYVRPSSIFHEDVNMGTDDEPDLVPRFRRL